MAIISDLFGRVLLIILLFTLSLTRSNGILIMIPLFFDMLRSCPVLSKLLRRERPPTSKAVHAAFHWGYFLLCLVSLAVPICGHLGHALRLYCMRYTVSFPPKTLMSAYAPRELLENTLAFIETALHNSGLKNSIKLKHLVQNSALPEYCYAALPNTYGYVQSKYWGVGLFRYWRIEKIDRWILAAPFFIFAVCAVVYFCKSVFKTAKDSVHLLKSSKQISYSFDVEDALASNERCPDEVHRRFPKQRDADPPVMSMRSLVVPDEHSDRASVLAQMLLNPMTPHIILLIIYTAIFLLAANCETFIRSSTCLVIIPMYISILLHNTTKGSLARFFTSLYIFWHMLCFTLGSVCFSKYFDWT
eukprot:GHVO01027779.1.p1 GENE.GHVO01027779.1~~GHVO01027779.1.p1  ORF type:complete len:416 (+),score=30.50 GHVO01027779.1:169-1248(+)